MNKKYHLLIVLLIFITKVNAQFTGYYNLHDGGVDMPSSSLFVLPNNEFIFFYFGGYKVGKWQEIDKENIVLTETKSNTNPISIYGKNDKNQANININVYSLATSHAFISFSKDTIINKELQPIFNSGANCLGDNYTINKKIGEYNWVTFTLPFNPEFGKRYSIKYPYKALTYTFPLDKKYSDYLVVYDEDAQRENMTFRLTKKEDDYMLDGNERKLEKKDLTDEILKKIENGKIAIDNDRSTTKFGHPISCNSVKNINIYQKPILKPIFTAKCKGDETETESESKIEKQTLTTADRTNGFYAVVNYKENEYDPEKYKLAIEPSITKDDILSVNKIVSDYGGYEIELIFTEKGRLRLAEFSKNNIKKPFAIVVNKLIISTPIFFSEITGGKANIAGDFSESEIDELITNFKK